MLTVRYARPEMRAPIRTWLRTNVRTLVGLGVAAAALALIGFTQAGRRCGVDSGGAWDCALAGAC
jgi:hypothetical protein